MNPTIKPTVPDLLRSINYGNPKEPDDQRVQRGVEKHYRDQLELERSTKVALESAMCRALDRLFEKPGGAR